MAISDNFDGLSDNVALSTDSNWDVWLASGSGVATTDQHDDHSDLSQVIDMSTTGINWCLYQTQVASANHYVEADVFIDTLNTSGNECGVIARGNNSSMGSSVWDGYTAAFVKEENEARVRIWRVDNDVRTQIAETADIKSEAYATPGDMHLLRFELDGSTLTAFMDGTQVLQTTDSTYSSGQYAGCYINRNTSAGTSQPFFDNFEADSLAGDPVIVADSGAYVLAGTDASLERGRFLDIGAGAYVLSGTDASLEHGRFINIESGAYVLTGTAASLERGRFIDIGSGAYVFTGTAATLTHDTGADPSLSVDPGVYVLTGTDASLEFGRAIDADSGAYAFTGTAASLKRGRFLDIGSGAYVLSGKDVSLLFDRILNIESGAYVLTGSDVDLISSADVREFLVLTTPIIRELAKVTTITRTKELTNTVTREKVLSTKILQ